MSLSYWGVDEYRASWTRALQVLVQGASDATSCLVASITDPASSNFVFCWPLYRSGSIVHVQNAIIFLDELQEEFVPAEPWRFVQPRSTIDDDGQEISEWQTTVSEVMAFLQAETR
ncbi:hypothetical protein [Streptomyces sp. enrichment culture]|uniref:hypothetical protein n=1 Tax=Streptomyces sp. enrichment culture TaxID=1795815 RepID=UPI003F57B1BC